MSFTFATMESKIIIALIVLYLISSGYSSYRLITSPLLERAQKKINLYLVWLIPFFWCGIVLFVLDTKIPKSKGKMKFKDNWKQTTGFGGD